MSLSLESGQRGKDENFSVKVDSIFFLLRAITDKEKYSSWTSLLAQNKVLLSLNKEVRLSEKDGNLSHQA